MTSISSLAVVREAPRTMTDDEAGYSRRWRGVCESPHSTPAEMAVRAGRAALAASDSQIVDAQWLLHCGVGPQASQGWPIHHHIQNAVVGGNGNALEVKQNCAGGLTSWLLAGTMLVEGGFSMCTGADNWSWADRFANARAVDGEPFSDAAHAAVVVPSGGFVKILGHASASAPEQADDWRIPRKYWESTTTEAFREAYTHAVTERSDESVRRSLAMIRRAVTDALIEARVSPQYVSHFVPQASRGGEPFRSLARSLRLPWSRRLHEYGLGHGYLGVSAHAEAVVHLAETGQLRRDSIVLLLACEYQLSATAIVCRIARTPEVSTDGPVRVAS